MPTNPVATWLLTNNTTQDPTTYLGTLDGNMAVLQRSGSAFAPSMQATPNMTVLLAPGHVYAAGQLTEVGSQTSATITAPVSNPRIDRIVIDAYTGIVSVVEGTEAASPLPPAIPPTVVPVAQVLLQTTSSAITNSMITDERDLRTLGQANRRMAVITSSGNWTVPAGVGVIRVMLIGSGGGGGGGSSGGAAAGAGSAGGAVKLANGSTWSVTANGGSGGLGGDNNSGTGGSPGTGSSTGTFPAATTIAELPGCGAGGGGGGMGNSGSKSPGLPGLSGALVIAVLPVSPGTVLTATIAGGGGGGAGGAAIGGCFPAPAGGPGGSGAAGLILIEY